MLPTVLAYTVALLLQGDTHHVQGVAVDDARVWVTSVDRAARKGFLYEYDRKTGQRLRELEIQNGAAYHPGGFDIDDTSLWIPVAEYKPNGRTIIQRRSKVTLALISSFEVEDHIGCLTVYSGGLIGGNWDARKIYEWALDGKPIRVRANPNAARYQELKYRYGALVASGLYPKPKQGGVVQWLDPETLLPLQEQQLGLTDRGVPLTQEGMDARDGKLYLLPEDAPSRLLVLDALQQ